jgi:Domain of unknown function (DUF1735)
MIKQTNRLLSPFLLALLLWGISSCKKQETVEGIQINTDRPIAEFTDAKTGGSIATDFTTNVVMVDLTELRLFTRSWVREGDVKVKVISNPTVVGDYNIENGTSYTAFPDAGFSFESSELTLTQTERNAMIRIKLKPSDLLGADYAIGLSIAAVKGGEVSQIADKILINISVKNKYDGVYRVTGSCVDALGVYRGIYPNNGVALRTAGANSVDYLDPTYNVGAPFFNNAYIIINSATSNPAWLYSPRFVFNTTTDKATAILDTDGLVPTGVIDPAGPNQFTINSPGSKQFMIKYAVLGRFTITETWTYTGPR